MEKNYPFITRLQQGLEAKNQTMKWLADEIGRTDRWFYTIKDFGKIEYRIVKKISDLLEINFAAEYDQWRRDNGESIAYLAEPEHNYQAKEKSLHINISISGPVSVVEKGLSDMIIAIQKEGDKRGFTID